MGLRDRTMMILLYDSGARLAEVLDLKVSDVAIDGENPYIRVSGKGSKERIVPISAKTTAHLAHYVSVYHTKDRPQTDLLFYTVTKNVRVDHPQPYFMYNPVIRDQIYLAQNVLPVYQESEDEEVVVVKSGLEVATELVKFWDRYGYNGYAAKDMNDVELGDRNVDVYSYVNTQEIANLTQYANVVPGMVLGYLVNGQALYTALMPL